jgi:dTDP-6-deoxy-L-talose 4-dehydrogenase (NAD+)
MKVLVIGSGFIGTSIIQKLQEEGHEVMVLSRRVNPYVKCHQIVGDCFDVRNLEKSLDWEPTVVIQTAWVTTHRDYVSDPQNAKYAKFTIDLAAHLVQSSVQHFIVLGSCAEYGDQTEPILAGLTELRPTSFYAKQKIFAFRSIRDLLDGSGIRFTWVRIFQPYGPNQDANRLIPYLIKSLKNNEKIHLKDKETVLDWITTRDIASAISWVTRFQTPVEIDVGTSVGYTNQEILLNLRILLDLTQDRKEPDLDSSSKVKKILVSDDSPLFLSGWRPEDSLVSGLKWVLGT